MYSTADVSVQFTGRECLGACFAETVVLFEKLGRVLDFVSSDQVVDVSTPHTAHSRVVQLDLTWIGVSKDKTLPSSSRWLEPHHDSTTLRFARIYDYNSRDERDEYGPHICVEDRRRFVFLEGSHRRAYNLRHICHEEMKQDSASRNRRNLGICCSQ